MAVMGAIVEELNVDESICSPSAQGMVCQDGSGKILSTHDQLMHDGVYDGSTFSARAEYRKRIMDRVNTWAEILSLKGNCDERFGIDYVAWKKRKKAHLTAIEVNLRNLGTTNRI